MVEEKSEAEKEIEEQKKEEKSIISNIPPIAVLFIIGAFLLAYFFGNLSTNQWFFIIICAIVLLYFLSVKASQKPTWLNEVKAKEHLSKLLKEKRKIGEIHQNSRFDISLVSSLPWIDGQQREYFIPFDVINEKNIPKTYLARVNMQNGNSLFAECPEGFLGTEKPTIRRIVPQEWKDLKKIGLDKVMWSRVLRGGV